MTISSMRFADKAAAESFDKSKTSLLGSNRSLSYSYEANARHEYVSPHENFDDSSQGQRSHSRSNNRYCDDRGASSYVGTTQEEQDYNALRSTPEQKP